MSSAVAQTLRPRRRAQRVSSPTKNIVLTGNPNCGKTTLFNALTGLRAKVGNYPGVTVERKEGKMIPARGAERRTRDEDGVGEVKILDLPGTYSLSPQSLDEQIARDVLFHRIPEVPPPDVVVVVVDASNLQRNLYFATQVIELGYPTILALNMMDVAEENGLSIDVDALARELGASVVPLVASKGQGLAELRAEIVRLAAKADFDLTPRAFSELPPAFVAELQKIVARLEQTFPETHFQAVAEALLVLSDERFMGSSGSHYPEAIRTAVLQAQQRLDAAGVDWRSASIEARYACIAGIEQRVVVEGKADAETFTDRLDRILTHRVWGVLIFVGIMLLLFESIFTFAKIPMEWMTTGVDAAGNLVGRSIAPGDLNTLLVDGVIKGVGAVVVFLPQILLLFLFIAILEDTGYMARAAFLMDRLMSKVGLHGKSFIPMLSSFACAIPGIMATRTIESPKDRLVTILVAPLMSCSARLPVYTVLIAATIPDKRVAGILKLPGLTMLAMYMLGIIVALLMAWLFKKTLLRSATPMLIMELPPYKAPVPHVVMRHMWDRSKLFLRRAGTIILGINIILWFLATYPKHESITRQFDARRAEVQAAAAKTGADPKAVQAQLEDLGKTESGEHLRNSFAGYLGRAIAPLIRPLGMDWKIGIGIVGSFAAREVFVSTMSTVYNVGEYEKEQGTASLAHTLQQQRRSDGSLLYTPLMGITLMIFYVFALQCVSTVAIVRRETNSWKWPAFQWFYMTALAWVLAFVTWQGGRMLGF